MAADMNQVTIIGRLTREAELKYTQTGTAVSRLSIAVNRRKRSGDNWVDEVSFFDVVSWGKLAESLNPYLTKGKQIAVVGELRQNRWEQDGQKRSKVEIVAQSLQLLGGSNGQSQGAAPQSGFSNFNNQGNNGGYNQGGYGQNVAQSQPQPVAQPAYSNDDMPDFDDDIPF